MSVILDHYTLSAAWKRSRKAYKNLPFLGYAGEPGLSYGDVDVHIRCIQTFLKEQGIGKGDKVALISESSVLWGQVYFAIVTMGAVAVPVMPDFSGEQIGNILEHSEARFLFMSGKLKERLKELPLVLSGSFALMQEGIKKGRLVEHEGSLRIEAGDELLSRERPAGEDLLAEVREEDLAAILYTSGTTGKSKGVMLSHKNICHNAASGVDVAHVRRGSRFLSVLPLAHSYECTLGLVLPMITGASISYLKGPPTARIMLPALQQVKPHQMLTVPILIEKIYRSSIKPKFTSSKIMEKLYGIRPVQYGLNRFVAGKKLKKIFGGELRFFGIGGAPLAPDVERFLRDGKFPYSVGYGLTETSPCLAGDSPSRSVFRAIGRPFPDVELRIMDVNPDSGHGEIQARGPTIMKGYYKDEEKTAEVFTEDGWFKTGDLGYLTDDNILYVKGRLKNMILGANGENIYPEEIEAVLNRDPLVAESLVSRIGNTLVARVHLNHDRLDEMLSSLKKTPEELHRIKGEILERIRTQANASLSVLSRLGKMVEQVEPFEKTPSLKIKRFLYPRGSDKKTGADAAQQPLDGESK